MNDKVKNIIDYICIVVSTIALAIHFLSGLASIYIIGGF